MNWNGMVCVYCSLLLENIGKHGNLEHCYGSEVEKLQNRIEVAKKQQKYIADKIKEAAKS